MTDRIERELELDLPVDVLWRAVTEPERLAEWLADEVELELRPGGEARFLVDGCVRTGWVEEVHPPAGDSVASFAFWWGAEDEPASRVCIELEPSAAGVRLRVVEARPLEILDLVGIPLGGSGPSSHGPALVAA